MARRKKRATFFVCSSILDGKIISSDVEASSKKEASSLYSSASKLEPETVSGPFYLKRVKIPKLAKKDLQFSGITKKALYKGCLVNAFLLNSPKDHAYLVFIKGAEAHVGVRMSTTVIVPVEYLEFFDSKIM